MLLIKLSYWNKKINNRFKLNKIIKKYKNNN